MKFVPTEWWVDLALGVGAFCLYVISFEANSYLDGLALYAPGISLIFVPAGVKLLCILVGGTAAMVGLLASSVYLGLSNWGDLPFMAPIYFALIGVGTYGAVVYFVRRHFHIRPDLSNLRYGHVVVLSVAVSLFNGLFHNIVFLGLGITAFEDLLRKSAAMAFGDFLGCFIVVMLLSLVVCAAGLASRVARRYPRK